MYAWSSDCCVGQAGRRGLVNLFGTLGWQGTCRQGRVPAQSYVSTAAVLEYRLHCNARDMEGKARRVQGYGYGPGAGAGTTTRDWVLGTGTGTGTGHGTGAWEAGKGGLEVGGRGVRGGVAVGIGRSSWRLLEGGERQTRVGLTIEQRLSTLLCSA